ncbi:hypothetical protein F2Q69_00027998 [Brassica cretica]|uniref:Ubiquitin-like protease family profile domain-containing protein n=1 Tax=Brassica cretica TaxID=69181 RepID=A0A8S9S4C8_BRACR|nr:hypothetical protein F2Q69_00027998 [Brassica cretica]
MGVVMGKDEKVNIPHLYMKLAMDLEKLRNYPWVKEATSSEFEEAGEEKGEDQAADTERGENSHVAENVDGTADVSGRNKRKHADRGAESRKKNVLCQLAASSKGNIDTDMKNFLEGLLRREPMVRLDDRDMELDGEDFPDRCLVFVHPADFKKMHDWQNTRTAIQIGPSMLDDDLAGRIMSASSWLKNYEIDAVMYVIRERTTLKRWNVDCVAFMTCVFSDLIAKDYQNFSKGIKKYNMDPLLLEYGKGELPSHGRTRMLWNVDVDRMYVPVWVNCNHWIALCISFVTRNIQVFDCGGRKKIKEVEAFAQLIPPPASKRRRGSSSSGPAQTQCEDDTIPDISVDHTPDPSMEYLLPPYTGQFDSGAPPLDGTQQQQFV